MSSIRLAVVLAAWFGLNLATANGFAVAAEVVAQGDHVRLVGHFEPQDAVKLQALLQKGPAHHFTTITLNSEGGSIAAAMQIGFLVAKYDLNAEVEFGAVCYSACFVPFVVAPERNVYEPSRVGVHRLTAVDSDKDEAANATARSFYEQLGVPSLIIAKMFSTSGRDISLLSTDELASLGPIRFVTMSPSDILVSLLLMHRPEVVRACRDDGKPTAIGPMSDIVRHANGDQQQLGSSHDDSVSVTPGPNLACSGAIRQRMAQQMPPVGSAQFWQWVDENPVARVVKLTR